MATQSSALWKIRAYLVGQADYMVVHRNLHLVVPEIAFNALGPDGRPLMASMPLETHRPTLEQILRDAPGHRAGRTGHGSGAVRDGRGNTNCEIPSWTGFMALRSMIYGRRRT
jgi:hypothetical protein